MDTIKIGVIVEIPEELYCSFSAGQYDNMIDCQFCEWDDVEGKDYCHLFNKWLGQTNREFKDAVPCMECLEARLIECQDKIRRESWFGKMKRIGKKIGGVIVAIPIWKKRSS